MPRLASTGASLRLCPSHRQRGSRWQAEEVKMQNTKVKSDQWALTHAAAILTLSDLYFAF